MFQHDNPSDEGAQERIKVSRRELVEHLRRIYLNGLVPEVVLSGPLRVSARSFDRQTIVLSSGLQETESLPGPIGLTQLDHLISLLGCLWGLEIDLTVTNGELVCDDEDRRCGLRWPSQDS